MAKKEPTYSKAMQELESIIEEIESESIEVDTLAEKVKRASHLIGLCKGKLRDTEGEVKKVLDSLEGQGLDEEEEYEETEEDESEGDGGLF